MAPNLEDAIKTTQRTLKPIFSKPKCSSKLLSKPPFRFIHDIVTATMMATGFPKNYFTAQELASKNLKDKTSKVAFLNKLIHLVSVCHGSEIDVRPSKIVAGLEPIHTNLLLTLFGEIAVNAKNEIDHTAAIKYCQSGGRIEDFVRRKDVGRMPEKSQEILDESKAEDEVVKGGRNEEKETGQSEINLRSVGSKHLLDDNIEVDAPLKPDNIEEEHGIITKNQPEESQSLENKQISDKTRNVSVSDSLDEIISKCNGDPSTTKQMIGNIISKPKCSEKLLKKPPFRFLHDVIMAINKATGIGLENILSDHEMDSSMVKTKETKIKFLDKLIDFLSIRLSMPIDLRPSKVVAGLEAEKTCYFLQLLSAYALNHQMMKAMDTLKVPENAHSGGSPLKQTTQDLENKDGDDMNALQTKMSESKANDDDQNEFIELQSVDYGKPLSSKETSFNFQDKPLVNNAEEISESKEEGDIPIPDERKVDCDKDFDTAIDDRDAKKNDFEVATEQLDVPTIELDEKESITPIMNENVAETSREEKLYNHTSSIQEAFFGKEETENVEDIVDDVEQFMRPKTARRRPPRIKEKTQSLDVKKQNASVKKPIIFKEEPNAFDTIFGKDEDNINEGISRQTNVTAYGLEEMCASLQSIANAVSSVGRAMDFMPVEINAIRKESLHYSDEKARLDKDLLKAEELTKLELRQVKSQLNSIDDEIEVSKDQLEAKRRQYGVNEDWIKSQMRRICRV